MTRVGGSGQWHFSSVIDWHTRVLTCTEGFDPPSSPSVHQLTYCWLTGELWVDKCRPAHHTTQHNTHSLSLSLIAHTSTLPSSLWPSCFLPSARAGLERWTVDLARVVSSGAPLTNTQPKVLIDTMPSYFRTSVRRRGAAGRDRYSAA